MKWKHKLVQIAFRNYNSYVYHDLFLKLRLSDRLTKVWEHHDKASLYIFEVYDVILVGNAGNLQFQLLLWSRYSISRFASHRNWKNSWNELCFQIYQRQKCFNFDWRISQVMRFSQIKFKYQFWTFKLR